MTRPHLLLAAISTLPLLTLSCNAQKSSDNRVKVACVGDSITYGAGIEDREKNSYPSQLAETLGGGFHVRNFGLSGTTLLKKGNHPYWTTKPYHSAIGWEPQIVIIKLGTNDTKPRNWKFKDQVAGDLKAMVAAFRGLPSKPEVFLCLPAPAFPERWGIRDSVIKGELIPIIQQVAKQEKCPLIDVYKALEGKKDLVPDKVHPNKDGATLIAKTVHAALEKSGILKPATTTSK